MILRFGSNICGARLRPYLRFWRRAESWRIPFVIGEVAVGHLRNRRQILNTLRDLPAAVVASDEEVLEFIDRYLLAGRGLGYIDVHLLAAARLSHAGLWATDQRLQASAELLSLSVKP